MDSEEKQRDGILRENSKLYEPPQIVSYHEEELLELISLAHTSPPCPEFVTCASFSGAVVDC